MKLPVAIVDITYPHAMPVGVVWRFIRATDGTDWGLEGLDITLQIFDNAMQLLWGTDNGVAGYIDVQDNTIILIIDEDDEYYGIIQRYPPVSYRYSLDIGDNMRIQGAWQSIIEAGRFGL
jgi:hypothetical protein